VFYAPIFTGMKSQHYWKEPGSEIKKDHRYWVPLIALYSGMRLGEIIALTRNDFEREGNIDVMDIKDSKTLAGIRKVPVHPNLLAYGLVKFAEGLGEGSPLFPDTTAHEFSKFFSRFRKSLGITDSKSTFHSFRHTFIDALRNKARIEEPVIQSIVGHSSGNVTRQYGAGYSVEVLHDAVSGVAYPGVDLSHLKA